MLCGSTFDIISNNIATPGDDGAFLEQSDDERRETVSLDTWLHKPDIVYACTCRDLDNNGFLHPRSQYHILIFWNILSSF